MNPLIYNTLQFDQYSHLAICLNIYLFLVKILKTKLKVEKKKFTSPDDWANHPVTTPKKVFLATTSPADSNN